MTPETYNSQEESSGILTVMQTDENNDYVLDFPTELLEAMGWKDGDVLDIQSFAGRIVITKVSGS